MGLFVKFLAGLDLVLGLASLVVQIVAIASPDTREGLFPGTTITFSKLPTEDYVAGVWCGVVFALAGIAAFKFNAAITLKRHVHVWKILLLFGSLMAIGCGIAQIAISAVTLRDIDALRPCLESNGCPCKMLYDRNFCDTHTIFQALLITIGATAIATNVFLLFPVTCKC